MAKSRKGRKNELMEKRLVEKPEDTVMENVRDTEEPLIEIE